MTAPTPEPAPLDSAPLRALIRAGWHADAVTEMSGGSTVYSLTRLGGLIEVTVRRGRVVALWAGGQPEAMEGALRAVTATVDALGPDAPVEPVAAHVQAEPAICGTGVGEPWCPFPTGHDGDCGARTVADHPHTDPGDGRAECQTCGKFVWPVIHSCNGVPVTDAARARFAPDGGELR